LQAGRQEDAQKILGRIQALQTESGPDYRFGRAAMLVRQAQKTNPPSRPLLAEARGLLDQIILQRPSWGRANLALAQIEELEGNQENAIRDSLRAIELGDRNPAAIARVAQLLNAQRRYNEASLVLQNLRDNQTPLSPDLQRLEAQIAYQNQN